MHFPNGLTCSLIAVLLIGLPRPADAQQAPEGEPIIRIETGRHSASVKSIRTDRDCRLVVTGSDDKTVRIWSRPDGGGAPILQRTLRPPIGFGDVGKIYAVEMSPDGALVAVGGWSLKQPYVMMLFDAARGTMLVELGPLRNVVNRLAFSRDGRYLAAALGGGAGVRAWERQGAAEWRDVLKDEDFDGRDSYGVAFGPDGRLYAVGDDATVRRYSRAFKREVKVKTKGGQEPYSIAVHPDGKVVAVGYDDTPAVEILDADTLRLLHSPDRTDAGEENLSSVAWSRDGQRLWGAGRASKDRSYLVRSWDAAGRGAGVMHATDATNTIRDLVTCGEGIGYVSADPGVGFLDGAGAKAAWIGPVQADMRRKVGDAFTVSDRGLQVRFGLQSGSGTPVAFDVAAGRLSDAGELDSSFIKPRVEGIDIKDWRDTRRPLLRGQPIKLKEYETSRSLAIASDAGRFVLGTDWYLRALAAQGQEQWAKDLTGVAWGVALSGDNRIVVAALGDGTIRWHRMSDGRELLALFVRTSDRQWVAWTPKGYYAASEKGDDLIGWHQNRGTDRAAEFAFAHQRRDTMRRPDIVRRVIELGDEEKAIAELERK